MRVVERQWQSMRGRIKSVTGTEIFPPFPARSGIAATECIAGGILLADIGCRPFILRIRKALYSHVGRHNRRQVAGKSGPDAGVFRRAWNRFVIDGGGALRAG